MKNDGPACVDTVLPEPKVSKFKKSVGGGKTLLPQVSSLAVNTQSIRGDYCRIVTTLVEEKHSSSESC